MNGNMKLLLGFGYISGEYIDTALEMMPVRARRARGHGQVRALLAAAVIVSLLLALGAAAYAGNWFGIRDALLRQTEETVYLSVQGLESSVEFQAYQEFMDFYDDYTANGYYGDAVPQEQDEWMREHSRIYFCYTQRLKDKIFELCGKYGLKTRDGVYEEGSADIGQLYAAIGVDGFMRGSDFDDENVGFICYGDGSFVLQGMWYGAEKGLDCTVRRSMKGYFGQGYTHFDAGAVTERSYTTELGAEVTIIMDEYNGAVLYNGEVAFVTAELTRFDNETSYDGDVPEEQVLGGRISEATLERFADAIDFDALGKHGAVDLSAATEETALTENRTEQQMEYDREIAAGLTETGTTVTVWGSGLECTVTGISIDDNIYSAGWTLKQFHESSAYIGRVDYPFPDYIDAQTGELISGVRLVTVSLTVKNPHTVDATGNGGLANSGANNFANSIFVLKSGDVSMRDIYAGSAAYSGDEAIAGQYAYVHIEPGETVCYRLGYIIDDRCNNAEGAYLYCVRDTGGQLSACYIPVVEQ